ncbi:MAG: type II secretion system protein GspJ [Planctomycetes bacterium]|nr:type II secretion system protein GspJ [Planctomycetota bacterium]
MRRAFTLIELLLAMGVAALVLAALVPAVSGALRAQRQAATVIGAAAREEALLACLRDDLIAAPRPDGSLALPFTLAAAQVAGRPAPLLSFLAEEPLPPHPALAQRPAALGQALITWTLEADPAGGLRLVRSRQPHLLAVGTPPDPVAEPFLGGLAACSMEVLADGAWVSTWNSDDHAAALPGALRLRWSLREGADGSGPERCATIELPLAALDPGAASGSAP